MENAKLYQLRKNLDTLPVLKRRFEQQKELVAEDETGLHEMLERCEKETLDVDKLQKESIKTMLLHFTGQYERKLEKETQQMLEAKLQYNQLQAKLETHKRERDDLKQRIVLLEAESAEVAKEFADREQRIESGLTGNTETYRQLKKDSQAVTAELTEAGEVLRAIGYAENALSDATHYLDKAQDWAQYDIFSDGIFTHMKKYENLDEAEAAFQRLNAELDTVKKELRDMESFGSYELTGVSDTTRAVDFWLDNIFTDMNVLHKIEQNQATLYGISGQLQTVKMQVEEKSSALKAKQKEYACKMEEILLALEG